MFDNRSMDPRKARLAEARLFRRLALVAMVLMALLTAVLLGVVVRDNTHALSGFDFGTGLVQKP